MLLNLKYYLEHLTFRDVPVISDRSDSATLVSFMSAVENLKADTVFPLLFTDV